MGVSVNLELEDRHPDRVFVSVVVRPSDPPCTVDEVTVQLLCPLRQELGPRVLLPIHGNLTTPVTTTVELRSGGELPEGCSIAAVAWSNAEPIRATCPADPSTSLAAHLTGSPLGLPSAPGTFSTLRPAERASLHAAFPWLDAHERRPHPLRETLDADDEHTAEALAEDLGLGKEDAEWIASLLEE